MKVAVPVAAYMAALARAGCGGETTRVRVLAPGAEKTAATKVLETGAAVWQNKTPLAALNAWFHFYNGDIESQMEAHHYSPHPHRLQVFALDVTLERPSGFIRHALLEPMDGHVHAAGETIGTFARAP